jgi:hypothetical protein
MFAFIAVILFLLSPFVGHAGPWLLVTLGLACMAVQMVWGIGIPWPRRRGQP